MYYSELTVKELVNFNDGKKLGWAGGYDLVIDSDSGQLLSLVIEKRSWFGARPVDEAVIPWLAIKRIGADVMILDLPGSVEN